MNIVFFGSSQFAGPSLKALLRTEHKISCVVTQPDKPKGRGLHFEGTVIKTTAQDAGLEIFQPEQVNTPEAINFLRGLKPDLFVVIAYGQILSQTILDIPGVFSVNVHASLLPKYRGAAPINWAIIKGEKTTGVTIIKMARAMDAGPILLQKIVDISDDGTSVTLEEKLSQLAAQLLLDSLEFIQKNNYNLIPQDESKVSFAPKLKKEDGRINWDKPAREIANLVRGVLSWPGAFTYYNGKLLKIYKARVSQLASSCLPAGRCPVSQLAGQIININKQGIVVACGKDALMIEELQIEGKRIMPAAEFIAGHKICIGEILGLKK